MSASTSKTAPCLGFLTIVENAELGLLGGYLLLNVSGRPLEFHCTAPVKPSRTQEILYGPTLRPFMCGELFGQSLLAKSKLTPLVVCTDSDDVLAARAHSDVPMALVLPDGVEDSKSFPLARNRVAVPAAHAADGASIRDCWPSEAEGLDLLEPFARIREALEEAQKSTRAAA
jgi:hypothetical protein